MYCVSSKIRKQSTDLMIAIEITKVKLNRLPHVLSIAGVRDTMPLLSEKPIVFIVGLPVAVDFQIHDNDFLQKSSEYLQVQRILYLVPSRILLYLTEFLDFCQ